MKTKKKNTTWRNIVDAYIRVERFRMNPNNIDILRHTKAFQLGLILFSMFLIVSCSGTKKLEKSNVKTDVKTEVGVKKQSDENQNLQVTSGSEQVQNKTTDSSESKTTNKTTKVTDFDTSKPADPVTGKPPVLRETVTDENEITNKNDKTEENLNAKLNMQTNYNRQLTQKVDSQAKVISKLQSKTEVKTTPVSNWWKWLLVGIVVCASLVFLIIHFKWYEFIWNLIKKIFSLIKGG